jgi:hypothetical protein
MTSIRDLFLDAITDQHPVENVVRGFVGLGERREVQSPSPRVIVPQRAYRELPEPSVGCPTERQVRNAQILEDLMRRVCK